MKYIAYGDVHTDDSDVYEAKNRAIQVEREKFPNRYPMKLLFQDGTPIGAWTSPRKWFNLYEGTEEQLVNLSVRWFPEANVTFKPMFKGSKLGEANRKLNK